MRGNSSGGVVAGVLALAGLAAGTGGAMAGVGGMGGSGFEANPPRLAAAAKLNPAAFVPVPGDRELSGRIIVRMADDAVPFGFVANAAVASSHGDIDGDEELIPGKAGQAVEVGIAGLDFLGYAVSRRIAGSDMFVVDVPEGSSELQVAADLLGTGQFAWAEPDWIVFTTDCPNDTFFSSQWHHDAQIMDSCSAWDLETGSPDIVVAICDTGMDLNHVDFQAHRKDGINATSNLLESQGGVVTESGSHGTQVGGIGAGNGNDGVGVTGMGWNLGIRPVRVSENGETAASSVIANGAIRAAQLGDKAVNTSYSGTDTFTRISAGSTIKGLGGLLFSSAGNDARNLTINDRDADDLIVVGATSQNETLAGFSAFGVFVDLVAPGDRVATASPGDNPNTTSIPNDGARLVNGTSFSSPVAAGVAAMVWSADPTLTPDEVEQILKQATDDLGATGIDPIYGYGRLNLRTAIELALPPARVSFTGALPTDISPAGGDTLQVIATPGTDTVLTDSGRLIVAGTSTPMAAIGGDEYEATFPELPCAETVSYHVEFDLAGGGSVRFPEAGLEETALVVDARETSFADSFETNQGWTVQNSAGLDAGAWQRVSVVGNGERGDPATDSDGNGFAFVTGNGVGNTDVDGGSTTLTSPVFDLADVTGAEVSYDRFFTTFFGDSPGEDEWVVQATADGSTWVDLERTVVNRDWSPVSFNLSDFIPLTSTVQVRFIASDLGDGSVVEAAVDNFVVTELVCNETEPTCAPDVNADGVLNIDDFSAFVTAFFDADMAADINGDDVLDIDDFSAFVTEFFNGC
ncbi:MAG: S8 family serine peptidase [Planctomycetota bacterium]